MFIDKKLTHLAKMSVFPKVMYRFNAINLHQNPNRIFVEIDEVTQKVIWKCKRPKTAKTTLKLKNNVEGLTIPDFKTYYKSYSNQISVI